MNRKNIFKIILLIVIAMLFSFFVEYFLFNYNSVVNEKIDYSYNIQNLDDDDTINIGRDGSQIAITIDFPKAVYVSDFMLQGVFEKNAHYSLGLEYETRFGLLEQETITDESYMVFDKCYTPINKKIKKMVLYYNVGNISKVDMIKLLNKINISYERFFLMFSICLIILILGVYKDRVINKLEYCFLIISVLLGMSMILIVGLNKEGWDEAIHFSRIYSYSFVDNVKWNKAIIETNIMDYNTIEERNLIKEYYNEIYENGKKHYEEKELYIPYNMRGYLIQSIMIFVARHLGFSFYQLYLFGKIGNLLLYVICIYIAIKIARQGKLAITVLSLLPTPLFLAASYTYDTSLIAMVTLGFTIWMNEMFSNEKKMSTFSLITMTFLFVYGCSSKAVYIPLLLLVLLLPNTKFDNKKQMYLVKGMILLLFVIVMASFVMPVTSNTVAGNVAYGGDARGGDTGTVRQMKSILNSPFAYILLFFKSIISLENFGIYGSDSGLVTTLEYFTFSNMGTMNDKFVYLLFPMLMFMSFINVENDIKLVLERKAKIGMIIILLMVVGMVWSALYLDFTEIGKEHIYGVQARYYIPLMLPLMYLFTNSKLKINISYCTICRLFLWITLFLLGYGIYFELFLNVFNY